MARRNVGFFVVCAALSATICILGAASSMASDTAGKNSASGNRSTAINTEIVVAQSGTSASQADISDVQTLLNRLGYPAGPADGLMGPRTREAIRLFQSAEGLPATGTVDSELLQALRLATQELASAPTSDEAASQVQRQGEADLDERLLVMARGASTFRFDGLPPKHSQDVGRLALQLVFANNPNLLDEPELAFAAVRLLDPEVRAALFVRAGVDPGVVNDSNDARASYELRYENSLDEFDRRALLTILQEELPSLLKEAAPDGPLPLRIFCPLLLQEYDFDKEVYPLSGGDRACRVLLFSQYGNGEVSIGHNARVVVRGRLPSERLRFEIPVLADDARELRERILADNPDPYQPLVILGIDASLDRDAEQEGSSGNVTITAIPEASAVYRAADMRQPILELDLRPVPSLETVSAKPIPPVPFNDDTVNLLLMRFGELDAERSRMEKWARRRASAEHYPTASASASDPNVTDGWSNFFVPEVARRISFGDPAPEQLLSNFSSWTAARSEALPQEVRGQTKGSGLSSLLREAPDQESHPRAIAVLNPFSSSYKSRFDRIGERLGLASERLDASVYVPKQDILLEGKVEYVFHLPASRDTYLLDVPEGIPEEEKVAVSVELQVIDVTVDRVDGEAALVVLDVEPTRATLWRASNDIPFLDELASTTYDARFEPAQGAKALMEYKAGAGDRLADQLGNADLSGIRLGMPLKEAVSVAENAIGARWQGRLTENLTTRAEFYNEFVMLFDADLKDSISIFHTTDEDPQVIGVARATRVSKDSATEEDLVSALEAKYGEPSEVRGSNFIWTNHFGPWITSQDVLSDETSDEYKGAICESTVEPAWKLDKIIPRPNSDDLPNDFSINNWYVKAPQIYTKVEAHNERTPEGKIVRDPAIWTFCGPTVVARIKTRSGEHVLVYGLFDHAQYASSLPIEEVAAEDPAPPPKL